MTKDIRGFDPLGGLLTSELLVLVPEAPRENPTATEPPLPNRYASGLRRTAEEAHDVAG